MGATHKNKRNMPVRGLFRGLKGLCTMKKNATNRLVRPYVVVVPGVTLATDVTKCY